MNLHSQCLPERIDSIAYLERRSLGALYEAVLARLRLRGVGSSESESDAVAARNLGTTAMLRPLTLPRPLAGPPFAARSVQARAVASRGTLVRKS